MPTKQIEARDLGKALAREARKVHGALEGAAFEAAQHGRAYIVTTVIPGVRPIPVNTRAYVLGWKVERLPGVGAVLFNNTFYAPVIEYGRRPGSRPPPIKAIEEWVRRKMGGQIRARVRELRKERSFYGKKTHGGWFQTFSEIREIRSIAFLIARDIGKHGLPPKHVLGSAVPRIKFFLRVALMQRLREAGAGR